MREFLEAQFRGHPTIAPVLNLHLFTHQVPQTVHQKALAQITKLETDLAKLTKNHDTLVTKVNKKA